jgi:hypothetical protein
MRDVDGNVDRMRVDLDQLPELLKVLDTTARPAEGELELGGPGPEPTGGSWRARRRPAAALTAANSSAAGDGTRSATAAGWTRSAARTRGDGVREDRIREDRVGEEGRPGDCLVDEGNSNGDSNSSGNGWPGGAATEDGRAAEDGHRAAAADGDSSDAADGTEPSGAHGVDGQGVHVA